MGKIVKIPENVFDEIIKNAKSILYGNHQKMTWSELTKRVNDNCNGEYGKIDPTLDSMLRQIRDCFID